MGIANKWFVCAVISVVETYVGRGGGGRDASIMITWGIKWLLRVTKILRGTTWVRLRLTPALLAVLREKNLGAFSRFDFLNYDGSAVAGCRNMPC